MTMKRGLITDSFEVVKKTRREGKKEEKPSPPRQLKKEAETGHEEELEKLRQFDLDWRFGPCTGISRLQRWERAKLHNLNPPEDIKELLLKTPSDPSYSHSLWEKYPL